MNRGEATALRATISAATSRRSRVALTVALGAGTILATLGLLTTSGYLISRAAQRPEILALSVAIVGVRFFGISRALLRYAERLVSHDLAFRTLTELRARFFRRLIPLVPGGIPDAGRGDLLARFVGDVDALQALYLRALTPPLVAVAAGAFAVAVAFLILPVAALALGLGLLTAGVLAPLATRLAARSAGRSQAPARAALGSDLVAIASGSAELAVAGRADDWTRRAELDGDRLSALQRRDALSGGLAAGLLTSLGALTVVAVLAVAIPAVGSGQLPGVMLAALALLTMGAFEAVGPLGAAAASVDSCASASMRIQSVLERESPVPEPDRPVPAPAGELALRGVRYRYEKTGPWVLDGADLTLRRGEAVALVGASGAGKTTIAELCVRFREPTAGSVSIGGVPLAAIGGDEVRREVRLCAQDAYLFTSTVRDNVSLGRPGATEADVLAALDAVGLGAWVASLPSGLETDVGEAGARVSGGQRQRLALARSFLSDSRFLIFDEPSAHLDPEAGSRLLTDLAALAGQDRGVLAITHDRDALDGFGRVLELEGGRIRG